MIIEDLPCGNKTTSNSTKPGWCPEIFDSILCWPATPPGTVVNQSCPNTVGQSMLAFKECLPDGGWYVNDANVTWTNYMHCTGDDVILDYFKYINRLYLIGYAVSAIALIVSLTIFICFKALRCARIKIHVQLFLSFLLNNLLAIVWYALVVTKIQVTNDNPIWCQLLYVGKEFFMIATYIWMFLEALHLHIALAVVFLSDEKAIKWFYGFGWSVPVAIVSIHNIVRLCYSHDTDRCFLEESTFSTWFVTLPIAVTLIMSMGFLINILRVLITVMHPTSANPAPEGVKKAVRAALILTPLFGLQFLLIPVKPAVTNPLYTLHQYVSVIITSYQGLCCAILFCFANHEVHQAIRRTYQRQLGFQYTRSTNPDSVAIVNNNNYNCNHRQQNGTVAIPLLLVRTVDDGNKTL
ncbi:hypothetical protein ABEB36_006347 [Hypothenemus hampei]|uniref:Calcitonin receptor n=1 Tax=Hypothenemus hampei TaxID=57062 RepID=A0ABD1EQ77_HYPHA